MVLRARTLSALVAAWLVACGGESPEPTGAAPERAAERTDETTAPSCELGDTVERLRARARGGLAIHGGWTVALDDVLTVALDGAPSRRTVPEARRLLALLDVDGPLLLATGSSEEHAHCLIALDPSDEDGHPIVTPLASAIGTSRRATAGANAYLAWGSESGARSLEHWVRADDGIAHVSIALGEEPASEEAPAEILGLAADEAGWAAIWRRGATEDARSHVYLTKADEHRPVEALHDALVLEAIALDGEGVAVIAGFEFSRPGYARLTAGGPELRPLAPGDSAPAPFTDRVRANVEIDDDGLWLHRRAATGDPVGEAVHVLPTRVETATVARNGDDWVVAWALGDRVRSRTVHCE